MKAPALLAALISLTSAFSSPAQHIEPPRYSTNGVGMKLVRIPPGSFMMGSPPGEDGRRDDETRHRVTLTKSFYMGVHPVTQEEWRAVMGNDPSFFRGDTLPVERVSWDDCQTFLARMSTREGYVYRLPTEAEWEYCCRAGTTTPFYVGGSLSTDHANFKGDSLPHGKSKQEVVRNQTTPVGSFRANAWGLYDMHGNVWEWCADWYGPYPHVAVVDPKGAFAESAMVPEFILRLGSGRYAERLAATKALKEIGKPALGALRKVAIHGPDLEMQLRATRLAASMADAGECRVLRGGSFQSRVSYLRSASRNENVPSYRDNYVGFRVVAEIKPE
jgi:formylglycine-generating enzyme required for sulfatase activity